MLRVLKHASSFTKWFATKRFEYQYNGRSLLVSSFSPLSLKLYNSMSYSQ